MEGLDEAYGHSPFEERKPRRLYGGLTLSAVGALSVLAALVLVATGGDAFAVKEQAGLLAGIGIPACMLGVVAVLPASTRQRGGVVLGTLLMTLGVALFSHAYPYRWTRGAETLAFETAMIYGLGSALALWFVFTAIASTHLRNNPHGTVTLELVRQSGTKTVELSRDRYRTLVSDGGDPSDVIRELDD